jgi:hypothetical protein
MGKMRRRPSQHQSSRAQIWDELTQTESPLAGGDCETVLRGCLGKSTSTILRIVTSILAVALFSSSNRVVRPPLASIAGVRCAFRVPKTPLSPHMAGQPQGFVRLRPSPNHLLFQDTFLYAIVRLKQSNQPSTKPGPACNAETMKLSMLGAPRCNKRNHAPPGVPRTRSPAAQCSIARPRKAQPRRNLVATFCASSTNTPHLPYDQRPCVT